MENKLPEGWIACPLKDVVSSRKGKKPETVIDHEKKGYDPYLLIDELEGKPVRAFTNDPKVPRATKKDVLLVWDGSIGKCASGISGAVGSTIAVLSPKDGLNTRFLEYFIRRSKNYILETSTGTGLQHINKSFLKTLEIPLPSGEEQKRIANKLDVLLAKVKDVQSRLDKISRILKLFRQAIVKDACQGNFLRKKNEKTARWDRLKISDVAEIRLGKMLDKAKNKGEKTRYLRNINVRWFSFALDDVFYMQVLPEEKEKLEIKNGDVFLCEGGEPGRCAVWELGKTDMVFQKALHRIKFSKKVNPHWFTLNVKNDADIGVLEEYFTGSTIKHFTGKSLAKYEFPIPSIEDQNAIVRQVHHSFHQIEKIEERYISTKNYTDKLEQSILAKAFRGELVP